MAATSTFDLEIWFDGNDEPMTLRADQRDIAAFETEHKLGFGRAMDECPMVFFRYLGWHAARRLGKVPQGTAKDAWLDSVYAVEPEAEAGDAADPGQPAASEGNLSS